MLLAWSSSYHVIDRIINFTIELTCNLSFLNIMINWELPETGCIIANTPYLEKIS